MIAQDRYAASVSLLRTGIVIFLVFSKVFANGKEDLFISVYQQKITYFANSVRNFANSIFLAAHSFLKKYRWNVTKEELKKIPVVNGYKHNSFTFFFHDVTFQERLLHKKAIRDKLKYKEMNIIFSIK